jgi:hypothetical protein
MPCITYQTPEEESAELAAHAKRAAKDTYEPMLCSACRVLERLGYDFDENPKLSFWWDKHKRDDAERERIVRVERERKEYRQRIAQDALLKPIKDLSKEERAILKEFGYL